MNVCHQVLKSTLAHKVTGMKTVNMSYCGISVEFIASPSHSVCRGWLHTFAKHFEIPSVIDKRLTKWPVLKI